MDDSNAMYTADIWRPKKGQTKGIFQVIQWNYNLLYHSHDTHTTLTHKSSHNTYDAIALSICYVLHK